MFKSYGTTGVAQHIAEARVEEAEALTVKVTECDCGRYFPAEDGDRCEECAETYDTTAVHMQAMHLLFN